MQEDTTEADWHEHVGGDDAEGDCTGDQAAVHLQLVHDSDERGYQQRNERDVNRDEVLAHHAHDEDAAEDAPFRGAGDARRVRVIGVAQLGDDPVREQARQTRVGDRHGECAEEGVGQGDLGSAGQAVLEGDHRAGNTHSGHQAAHQRGDEKRDNDVHACDAEDQHDDHGEHDCVEKQHECSCVEGARKRHVRWRK